MNQMDDMSKIVEIQNRALTCNRQISFEVARDMYRYYMTDEKIEIAKKNGNDINAVFTNIVNENIKIQPGAPGSVHNKFHTQEINDEANTPQSSATRILF